MEEQVEMKDGVKKKVPAEGENGKQPRRISLYVGAVILQCIVFLVCLVLFGLSHARSPGSQTQWIYIRPSNISISYKKPIGIKKKGGSMKVNLVNRSVPIHCDGLYLFFLKGTITLQKNISQLSLMVYYQPSVHFLKINCSDQKTQVQEVSVHEFRSKDEVYLAYDGPNEDIGTSKHDLTLNLIMLTPRSYCYPEN